MSKACKSFHVHGGLQHRNYPRDSRLELNSAALGVSDSTEIVPLLSAAYVEAGGLHADKQTATQRRGSAGGRAPLRLRVQ